MAGRYAILPLVGFFILVFAFFSFTANRFASATNIENLLSGFSFVAMLAVGQAFPILLRGIDLSVGAIMAVVGMVVFDLSLIFGFPGWLILPVALLVGAAAGALNGILVVYVRLQPFIATLATLAAYRGLVYSISGRQLVPELSTTPLRDPWIVGLETYFDIGRFLGISSIVKLPWIPLSFLALLALVAVLQFVLTATRFGRDLFAVGGNPEGARLAGINVARVTIAGYAICGACAALAALFLVAQADHRDRGAWHRRRAYGDRRRCRRRGEPSGRCRLGRRSGDRRLPARRDPARADASRRVAIRAADHDRRDSARRDQLRPAAGAARSAHARRFRSGAMTPPRSANRSSSGAA